MYTFNAPPKPFGLFYRRVYLTLSQQDTGGVLWNIIIKNSVKDGLPYLFHSFRNKYFNKISLGNMLLAGNQWWPRTSGGRLRLVHAIKHLLHHKVGHFVTRNKSYTLKKDR